MIAERLLRGGPIDDLSEAYQRLGQLLADARRPGTHTELAGSAAAAAAFVAGHHAANSPRRRVRSMGVSAFLVLTLAATTGTGAETPETPSNDLPDQSNGPPQVPPRQAEA